MTAGNYSRISKGSKAAGDHAWSHDHGLMASTCTACGLQWLRSATGPGSYVVGNRRGVPQLRSARQPPPSCIETPPRSACADGPRPCRWQSCRHRIEPASSTTWDIPAPTCALDVADAVAEGADVPEYVQIGRWLGVSKQRIQQIEGKALEKLVAEARARGLPVVGQPRRSRHDLEDQIMAVIGRGAEGLTFVEIAAATGRNVATLHSALQRLRKAGRLRVLEGRPARWVACYDDTMRDRDAG